MKGRQHDCCRPFSFYLRKESTRADVLLVFAGLRPLVSPKGADANTAGISREHYLAVSSSGLVTINGGKWTTYRKMAEDALNQAAMFAGLDARECVTKTLRIHGWMKNTDKSDPLRYYGSDILGVKKLIKNNAALNYLAAGCISPCPLLPCYFDPTTVLSTASIIKIN